MAMILLIEDDLIVQHVHTLMFHKLGHQVDLAQTGLDAQSKIKTDASKYHIIFVDVGLPDICGTELIKEIRLKYCESSFPIIALTGYIGETEKKACLAAGASQVLHKPVLMSKMLEILNYYLAH